MKNSHRGMLLLVKVFFKSITPAWVLFTFFELRKDIYIYIYIYIYIIIFIIIIYIYIYIYYIYIKYNLSFFPFESIKTSYI